MSMLSESYDVATRLLRWASPTVSRGSSKVAEGVRGRTDALEVLSSWVRIHRTVDSPLIWTHAPSVGEGLQAKAVLEALLEVRPELQSVYTFFSPSAERFARDLQVNVAGYLPGDVKSELELLLAGLAPGLVSFTKTEVWPGLTAAAVGSGIPVILCAATLSAGARRRRLGARQLLRPTFGALSKVLAIAQEDGERFLELGVSSDCIEVTGDPGIDSAWSRVQGAAPEAPYLAPFLQEDRPTLVAGSTWRSDEELLVPVLKELGQRFTHLRSIIAPHEPNPTHLDRLEMMIRKTGLRTIRLEEVERKGDDGGADIVLVDRVGVLAHLYSVGSVAYVGGGFQSDGLHSVLEPAAAGLPVVFGPRHEGARAASDLIRLGGAQSIEEESNLTGTLHAWLEDAGLREESGANALGYIERHRGAAGRTALAIAEFLPA